MSVMVLELTSDIIMIANILYFVRMLPRGQPLKRRNGWPVFLPILAGVLFLQFEFGGKHFILEYLLGLLIIFTVLFVFYSRNQKMNLYIALWGLLAYMTARGMAMSIYSLVKGMPVELLVQETASAYRVRILGYLIVFSINYTCGVDTMKVLPEVLERKLSYRVLMAQMAVQYVLLALAKEMCAIETEYRAAGVFYLSLCVTSAFIYMISLNYAKAGLRQMKQYKEKEQILKKRMESQLENYRVQAEYIENIRAFKHDYLNQMRGITYLMESGRMDEVRSYVTEFNDEMRRTDGNFRQYSNVPIIDAMLRDMQSRCGSQGIAFDASLQLKKGLCLTPFDQCMFFSELLDTALKAALSADEKERCIWIENRFRDQWTVIKCTAYCDEEFEPETQKIERMRSITESSGGFFDSRVENGVFSLLCSWMEEEHSGTAEKTNI